MKILIFHRIPFSKVRYDQMIDHTRHSVTYCCENEKICDLLRDEVPLGLAAQIISRSDLINIGFDRVIALSEYDLMDAALFRDKYSILGPGSVKTLKVRDKVAMKAAISEAGIRAPRYFLVDDYLKQDSKKRPVWTKERVILKPRSGASSEGISECLGSESLNGAIEMLSNPSDYEIEEFISGPIVHFDGFVLNGLVQVFQASRYAGSCLEFARGIPLGSYQVDKVTSQDHAWIQAVLNGLEVLEGVFHIEAFDLDGELVFLEAANRCGGADVVPLFEKKWGVNLYLELIRSQLLSAELPCSRPFRPVSPGAYGWYLVPSSRKLCEESLLKMEAQVNKSKVSVLEFRKSTVDLRARSSRVSYKPQDLPLSATFFSESSDDLSRLMTRLSLCSV